MAQKSVRKPSISLKILQCKTDKIRKEEEYQKILNTHPDELFRVPKSRNLAAEKTRGVLAVVHNCGSPYRNYILDRLGKLIMWPNGTRAIDYYGSCGTRYDSRNRGHYLSNELFAKILPKYRFYFGVGANTGICRHFAVKSRFGKNSCLAPPVPISPLKTPNAKTTSLKNFGITRSKTKWSALSEGLHAQNTSN